MKPINLPQFNELNGYLKCLARLSLKRCFFGALTFESDLEVNYFCTSLAAKWSEGNEYVTTTALEGFNSSEKYELLDFVRSIVRENPSNQDLIDLWAYSGASDILASDQMTVIYEVMLKAIESSIQDL